MLKISNPELTSGKVGGTEKQWVPSVDRAGSNLHNLLMGALKF